jgi:hypothetical protein
MRAEIDPDLDDLTEKIIGAAFTVSRVLGHGFLEAVYKNALLLEMRAMGLAVEKEKSFPIELWQAASRNQTDHPLMSASIRGCPCPSVLPGITAVPCSHHLFRHASATRRTDTT